MRFSFPAVFAAVLFVLPLTGQSEEISADELAGKLSQGMMGSVKIRTRLESNAPGAEAPVLQLQIKERRRGGSSDIAYEVLWPKNLMGRKVILQQSGRSAPSVTIFTPPDSVVSVPASKMRDGLFGSDLAYQDAVENFFAWPDQEIVGKETIDGKECLVLESKPGGTSTIYAKVRTYVDPERLVPMRVEKLSSSGAVVRRIDTTRVVRDDRRRSIPANLTVRAGGDGTVSKFSGSRIDHDVTFSDADFAAKGR